MLRVKVRQQNKNKVTKFETKIKTIHFQTKTMVFKTKKSLMVSWRCLGGIGVALCSLSSCHYISKCWWLQVIWKQGMSEILFKSHLNLTKTVNCIELLSRIGLSLPLPWSLEGIHFVKRLSDKFIKMLVTVVVISNVVYGIIFKILCYTMDIMTILGTVK